MARTTDDNVKTIILIDSSLSTAGFIATATSLVDRIEDADSDSELDSDALELIERWLTAHFYSHRDQLFASKGTGAANASFQGQFGLNLDSTQYGQTAKLLDTTGYLAQLDSESKNGKKKIGLAWLGKDEP